MARPELTLICYLNECVGSNVEQAFPQDFSLLFKDVTDRSGHGFISASC